MSAEPPPGQVITFYSYKGGTGRTMGMANVACLLAERGGEVLLVDWDLEAPGLHRFFPAGASPLAPEGDLGLDARPGLIDLFLELDRLTPPSPPTSEEETETRAAATLEKVRLEPFVGGSGVDRVHLLRAGRNDDGRYAERVSTFNWEGLFRRSPALFRMLAERWAAAYRWVLIDSRTGLGDISGICTSLMPERLVVVFTPNRQSVTGIRALVERATAYRRQSDDLRPLVVFPLPSRIEATREDLRTFWRLGREEQGIAGYQPMFEELLAKTYGLTECKLARYFDEVQIQQTPDYAYGEQIAVQVEYGDRFSLASSFRVFTEWLVNAPGPWQRQTEVDTLLETLKERVGVEELGERRETLQEIVGKLEESVKREPTSRAPSVSPPQSVGVKVPMPPAPPQQAPESIRSLGKDKAASYVPTLEKVGRIGSLLAVGIVILFGVQFLYNALPQNWSPITAVMRLVRPTTLISAPTLVGVPFEEAVVSLTKLGLKVGRTQTQVVSDARPGVVLGQSVQPGDKVDAGTNIDLVIATPPIQQQQGPPPSAQPKPR